MIDIMVCCAFPVIGFFDQCTNGDIDIKIIQNRGRQSVNQCSDLPDCLFQNDLNGPDLVLPGRFIGFDQVLVREIPMARVWTTLSCRSDAIVFRSVSSE